MQSCCVLAHLAALLCLSLGGCGRVGFQLEADGGPLPDAGPVTDAGPLAPSSFRDLCRFQSGSVIDNGVAVDREAGEAVSVSIGPGCATSMTWSTLAQASALEPGTNRPILGPARIFLAGGGPSTQDGLAYLETSQTPVRLQSFRSTYRLVDRSTGQTIATFDASTFGDGHDVAVLQVALEPISRTFVLSVYGALGNGTTMAAWWFADRIAPGLPADSHRYYVVEWTDRNGDGAPDAGDSFVVHGSG
ncbi:MAG: hypothetical protein K8H88_13050 [Sandaracinaceae bacterium]|nr:hypothetical protein [Sandaracinaceae bacterium]